MSTPAAALPVVELVEKGLVGPRILINGESGTGKTFSLGTLVDWCQKNGKEVFYLDLEGSLETLLGYWRDEKVPPFNRPTSAEIPPCLHWHQMRIKPVGLKQMMKAAQDVATLTYESITKTLDANRGENNSMYKILEACSNFHDDRTGKDFGPVDRFDTSRVFVLDSFTELSNAFAKTTIGGKPTMNQPEYGVTQTNLMNFVRLCTQGMSCTFVMTAHPAKDKDEVSGQIKTTLKTVGTAIQPEIPPLFSDFIYSVREADKFYWDTAAYGVVTKTRSLGYRSKITPDFAQIMDLWKKRGGK